MKRKTFRKQRRKILKAIDDNKRNYEKEKKRYIKENRTSQELADLNGEFGAEFFMYKDELKDLYTDWYRYRCNKLDLPMYEENTEYWESLYQERYKVLTEKGRAAIRTSIRNEIYEKQKIAFSWITIMIGLIGALTGLLSIIGN